MSPLASILDPIRRIDLDRLAWLRPAYPPVALEVDRGEMVLVRLRRHRGRPSLEAHQVRSLPEQAVGSSILRPNVGSPEELSRKVRDLFESTGTRPGKVSLVLPDNLARVSLITLPERPPTRRQLLELIRFKLRRAVPFRLEDAVVSHQVLPADGKEMHILVAIMLRSVVEQYEHALAAAGARPGLVDLATPCLFNLCRPELARLGGGRSDVALLNCARGYFSLVIVRGSRIVFYRCKSIVAAEAADGGAAPDSALARELASSMSYYQEKLDGQGIAGTLVRSVSAPVEDLAAVVERLGMGAFHLVDPSAAVTLPPGLKLETGVGQRIASAVGAAAGRGN